MARKYKEMILKGDTIKIASIVGARPQFIKLIPIVKAINSSINNSYKIKHLIIHTGQHYDYLMNKVFFDELQIPEPDYNLEVGSGTHGYQTGTMLKKIEEVLLKEKPNIVIVYGDTNSTLAGALAAVKLHIPIAHIEAGLRSYNKLMPEEINRILTDHISTYLFCPSKTAVKNLKKEGIKKGVYLVGDVMYDTLLITLEIAKNKDHTIIQKLNLKPKEYALVTIHREENTTNFEIFNSIFSAIVEIANNGLTVVFPVHPRTRKVINTIFSDFSLPSNLLLIEPISYLDMILLEANSKVILTDSGGVQKEAFFLKVPCITLRQETEWIETVKLGWNTLAGTQKEKIIKAVFNLNKGKKYYLPYGKGKAAQKIVNKILSFCLK